MLKLRLFCFPYAGSSSSFYMKWAKEIRDEVELLDIELAGRGKRSKEPFYTDFRNAIEDIYSLLSSKLDDVPYAFYGHSMGSLIAYELCHLIKEEGRTPPVHVFLSGCKAPSAFRDSDTLVSQLPDEEFKEEILRHGLTPASVFENKELFDIFIPILRADYTMVDNYCFDANREKLGCNFTIMNGKDDVTNVYEMIMWRELTEGTFDLYEFHGGHFFIHDNLDTITNIINDTFSKYIK